MSRVEKLDPLIAAQLQAALPSAVIGRQIVVLEQTGSTNDAILQVASSQGAAVSSLPAVASATEGPPSLVNEGLVLFAEHQTAGRGQRGNRWESAAGKGLWFSILLRPQIQINESWRLTVWAIEAISEVIRAEFALDSTIKMPNDVQLHGRKVAGVLDVHVGGPDQQPSSGVGEQPAEGVQVHARHPGRPVWHSRGASARFALALSPRGCQRSPEVRSPRRRTDKQAHPAAPQSRTSA